MAALLQVEDLHTAYGLSKVLFGISAEISAGECVCLLGRNGVGKSTTMKSIMGLITPQRGRVVWKGRDITGWPAFRVARAGIGFVPEDRRVFPDLSVWENLDIAARAARRRGHWTVEAVYELFPQLASIRTRMGGYLSGGEQQMLTIARTLMGNPSLVLLDEPSEGLSPKIVEQMVEAILAMKREGVSIVVSEQNLHFARLISDRAYIIERGKICFGGTMAELDARPDIRDAHLSL
jgi:branched-chain amino acid transport system ATP-binding protein